MLNPPASPWQLSFSEHLAGEQRGGRAEKRTRHMCHDGDTTVQGLDWSSPRWHFAAIYVIVPCAHGRELDFDMDVC